MNEPPTADISTSAISGTTPHSVDFTGDQSFDNDGSIVSYFWEFGENNRTSSEANPTYEYISPGDYIVTLIVTDDDGATNSATITISVNNPKPKAVFNGATSVFPQMPSVNGTVTVSNGPVTFQLGGFGGTGSGEVVLSLNINGQIVTLELASQENGSEIGPTLSPGTYNYSLSMFSAFDNNSTGGVSILPP
ncbi:PKD domain-containing protein [Zobellia nedashkovskayae]